MVLGFIRCQGCFTETPPWTRGNQPRNGCMTERPHQEMGSTLIAVTFDFKDGIQDSHHPRPGMPFKAIGFPRTSYFPDNHEGRNILCLLRKAFNRFLLFNGGRLNPNLKIDVVETDVVSLITDLESAREFTRNYLRRVVDDLKRVGISQDD